MGRQVNRIRNKEIPRSLRVGSFNYKVFSSLASLMKKTGQDIKSYLDDHGWFDPVALRKHFYGYYYSEIEDSAPTDKEMREAAIKEAIKKLELSDYIKITKDKQSKDIYKISLTKKGILEFIKYSVDTQKEKRKWDGKWRIVIFDILESKRHLRNVLRNRLRWLGFKELQKSVWIFPYDVSKELKEALKICNVDIIGDVRFLTVEKIDEDEDLREEFGIK